MILVGNGGSAAVAAHIANDLVKAGTAALSLTDAPTLTCLSNDFGYVEAYAYQVNVHARKGDKVVCISSSGMSKNILMAAQLARGLGAAVITLSGFSPRNRLRKLGQHNYYVPSEEYGIVEVAHLAILHSIAKPT